MSIAYKLVKLINEVTTLPVTIIDVTGVSGESWSLKLDDSFKKSDERLAILDVLKDIVRGKESVKDWKFVITEKGRKKEISALQTAVIIRKFADK